MLNNTKQWDWCEDVGVRTMMRLAFLFISFYGFVAFSNSLILRFNALTQRTSPSPSSLTNLHERIFNASNFDPVQLSYKTKLLPPIQVYGIWFYFTTVSSNMVVFNNFTLMQVTYGGNPWLVAYFGKIKQWTFILVQKLMKTFYQIIQIQMPSAPESI